MKERIEKFIEIHFRLGVCNLKCSYCYVGQHGNKMLDIPYTLEEIKKAFSKKRLGGTCFINICSDGETLIHPMMPSIIRVLLEEGHYVLVVTNGILKNRIRECIDIKINPDHLFFKLSFHYEEMIRLGNVDMFFENVNMIKESKCSFTVEYIACDEAEGKIDEIKALCMEKMKSIPQVNMPREDRAVNLGILSKHTLKQYLKIWEGGY